MSARDERIKLLATAFNTLGTNTAIAGGVVPFAAFLYQVPSAPSVEHLVPACFVWPLSGFVLHLFGRHVLKGLDE